MSTDKEKVKKAFTTYSKIGKEKWKYSTEKLINNCIDKYNE